MKRIITISLCMFAVLAFSFTSLAQDLNTSAGTSNSVVSEGPDALLFDQTGNPGSNGAPSQFFPDFSAAGEAADDFVVPAGEVWTIDTVFIVGTFTTTGLYIDLDVNFFADDGFGLPGALADSRLGLTAGTGPVFTVPLSPPVVLTEGTYWLNFMVNMDFTTNGQFFWSTSAAPVVGFEYAWRDSAGLFGTPCVGMAWNYGASVCGVGGGVDPDLQFALYGTSAPSGPTCDWLDDFTAGTGNWTITNDGGTCIWEIHDASEYSLGSTGAAGNVLAADADACGSGSTTLTTATLITPIDATMWQTVWLDFDHDWNAIDTGDSAYVDVSTDGGTTWMNVVTYDVTDVRDTHESFDISSMVGESSFLIRLKSVQPGWDWWWAVDNICVSLDDFVPVELTSFVASVNENDVTLSWTTGSETNNLGFEVERNSGTSFEKIGFVAGFGTSSETHAYSFVDASLSEGTYSYRLKQVDHDGTFDYSEIIEVDVTVPDVFALEQNYPNPFNPSTRIDFSLAVDSKVSLKVFDILGQEVVTLISSDLSSGSHKVDFDASALNSGVYFYRIEATGIDGTNFTNVKKMILTK